MRKRFQNVRFRFAAALAVLASLVFFTTTSAAKGSDSPPPEMTVVIGTELDYPPYSFAGKDGRPTGFNVELTRAIATVMAFEAEIRIAPWAEIRSALESGGIDAVAGMYFSEERDRKADFSVPFAMIHHAVFQRGDSPTIGSEMALRGKTPVVMKGDIMHDYVLENGISNAPVLADTQAEALRMLAAGVGDCALLARLPGLFWRKELALANIRESGLLLRPSKYCFAVREGDARLQGRFTEGLSILKNTGKYQEIYDKWLGVLEPRRLSFRRKFEYAAWVVLPLLLLLAGYVLWVRLLQKQVATRTRALKAEMENHRHARSRLERLNRVLLAIRNVNQLITQEKDRARLLDNVCRCLTETRGYFNAWIALTDAPNSPSSPSYTDAPPEFHQSGLDGEVEGLTALLERKAPPLCCRLALERDGVVITEEPSRTCGACPLASNYEGRGALTVRLAHNGNHYGLFSVSVPQRMAVDSDEISLFEEVASDIAFALHDLELAEERAALDRSLRRASLIVENSASVLFRWRAEPDWPVEYVSRNISRFGYAREDFLSGAVKYPSIIHPDDMGRVVREVELHSVGGAKHFQQEYRIFDAGGAVRWLDDRTTVERDEAGAVVAYQGIVIDITERKQAEKRLRLHERINDTIPHPLAFVDRDYRYLAVNHAHESLFAARNNAIVGKRIADFCGESLFETEIRSRIDRCLAGREVTHDVWIDFPGPGRRCMAMRYSPYYDEHGRITGVVSHGTDITERKAAEEALRESERRYRTLFEDAVVGIFRSTPAGRLVEVNPAYARMFGYESPAEVLEKVTDVASDIYADPEDRRTHVDGMLLDGRPIITENRYRKKDGSLFTGVLHCWSVTEEATGEVLLEGFVEDVSERKATEAALARSEHEKTVILESTSEMFAYYGDDLRIRWANRAAADAAGLEAEELVGRRCHDVFHGKSESCPGCPVLMAMRTLSAHEAEIETPDGRFYAIRAYPVIDASGEMMGIAEFGQDISERRRAEAALRESEARFRELAETVPLAIEEIGKDGGIRYVNPAYTRIYGYTADEVIGTFIWNYAADPEALRADIMRLLEEEPRPQPWHGVNVIKSGREIDVRVDWDYRRDADGNVRGFIAVISDISDQLRLEAQYRHAQKMEAVGRLAGGVAHDLNNLLTPILGYAELLLDDTPEDDLRRPGAEEIFRAGERARDLVRQLLAFGRKQTLEMTSLNLNDVITGFEKLLRRTILEDIDVLIDLADALPEVKADAGQLEQIIMNLAVNAQDAMPDGGSLTIETAKVELDEAYTASHQEVPAGRYAMLAVTDTGIGMDAATIERIFEPFFTTKEKGKGTGLGLSTVYGIVKQHGGAIWVYSEPGRGTTFKIYLPADLQPDEAKVEAATPTELYLGGETVLIVEDDAGVRHLAATILKSLGYRVLIASTPGECIDIAKVQLSHSKAAEESGGIDLLLTDVVMPEMNGKVLAERLKRQEPELRVLFMSGYTDNVIADRGILREGVHFLQKPFSRGALARKVREVLEERAAPSSD